VKFVLVDKVTEVEPGRRARGYRDLAAGADYYRDHLPAFPVEPGVLILESMAQLGGRLVQQSVKRESGRDVLPMLAMVNHAEFRRPVRPPCRLDLDATIRSVRAAGAKVDATATVDGEQAASATVTYVLVDLDHDAPGIGARSLAAIRTWGERTWAEMTAGAPSPAAAVPPGDRTEKQAR
jgi:3-hydroxyacyl-[acyl-carrier-protein] dehydratase